MEKPIYELPFFKRIKASRRLEKAQPGWKWSLMWEVKDVLAWLDEAWEEVGDFLFGDPHTERRFQQVMRELAILVWGMWLGAKVVFWLYKVE